MNEKFEFTGEIKKVFGVTLQQIRAKKDFANVKKGEIGGWIEKESNLDVYGDAWVSGDACVYGDAQVYGDACVYGDAQVYGDARVYGDAWVYGDARVYGDAQVYGDAWVCGGKWSVSPLFIQGSKYSICMYTNNKIKIGCQIHTIKQWLSHGEAIAKAERFTPEEIEEYRWYVELAAKRYGTLDSTKEDKHE